MANQNGIFDEDGNVDTQAAAALFAKEVRAKALDVDPGEEADWHSLTLGWALGKGMEPCDAYEFATFIRYDTDLG
jgi:hypothetical protein